MTQVSLRSVIKGGGDRAWGARRATPFSFPIKCPEKNALDAAAQRPRKFEGAWAVSAGHETGGH